MAIQLQLAALRRGFAVLRCLARQREAGCTFTQLRSVEAKLTAASLSRLLKVMQADELVRKDEATGLYFLGAGFVRLVQEVAGSEPVAARLQPLLAGVSRDTGESVAFFELRDNDAVLCAKEEVPEGFHYIPAETAIGSFLRHGVGQVIMAWSSPARRRVLSRVHGPEVEDAEGYARRLEQIRAGDAWIPDLMASRAPTRVAAPVFLGDGGPLAGVLAVSSYEPDVPSDRRNQLVQAVQASAHRATALLAPRS